jgi:hypothetical protein
MDNIFCTIEEQNLDINLLDTENINVNLLEEDQKINIKLAENEEFDINLSENIIKVIIEGGLKGESGHTHSNLEMLESLRYDYNYKAFLVKDN